MTIYISSDGGWTLRRVDRQAAAAQPPPKLRWSVFGVACDRPALPLSPEFDARPTHYAAGTTVVATPCAAARGAAPTVPGNSRAEFRMNVSSDAT
jgi:hypothetical protein